MRFLPLENQVLYTEKKKINPGRYCPCWQHGALKEEKRVHKKLHAFWNIIWKPAKTNSQAKNTELKERKQLLCYTIIYLQNSSFKKWGKERGRGKISHHSMVSSSRTYQTPILSLKEFWSSTVWRLGSQRIKGFYPMRWGTCTYRVTAQPYVCRRVGEKKANIRILKVCIYNFCLPL